MCGLNAASNFDLFPPRIALKISLMPLILCSSNISSRNFVFHASGKKDKNKYVYQRRDAMEKRHPNDGTSMITHQTYEQQLPSSARFAFSSNLRQTREPPAKIFGADELQTLENRRGAAPLAEASLQPLQLAVFAQFHDFLFIPVFDSASLAGGCFWRGNILSK